MVNAPKRIQRRRTKGWRMPEGAVYVGRPTLWGNPWAFIDVPDHITDTNERAQWCVNRYRAELQHWGLLSDYSWLVSEARWDQINDAIERSGAKSMGEYAALVLRGRDLVCWCPLDQPCHADVLLEIANHGSVVFDRIAENP